MNSKAITLIELLMSIVILGLVLLGFSSIDLFSNKQIISSNKLIKTQNEAAVIVEAISKEALKAIGDIHPGHEAARLAAVTIAGESCPALVLWIDNNQNGIRDSAPPDKAIAFSYSQNTHEIRFHQNYDTNPTSYDVLSRNAYMPSGFNPVVTDNYIGLEIGTCWDPANARTTQPCDSPDNPFARLQSRIMMPAVSTH